jgi:hypothetical protein
MKKILLAATLLTVAFYNSRAQEKADTVIVPLANSSKVIFIMKDRSDLKTLEQYDFEALFDDILDRIKARDTTGITKDTTIIVTKDTKVEVITSTDENGDDDNDNDRHHGKNRHHRSTFGRTWQSTNLDLGMNNYMTSFGDFPDGNENHNVRPWGSWYVGINSTQRTRLTQKVFLEWGLGVSWYNFKFEKDNIEMTKNDHNVQFNESMRLADDFIKSKLMVSYVNASLVPVFDIGGMGEKHRKWEGRSSQFRFGVGPYVGYRIGSRNKLVFKEEGKSNKKITHDNFYLNDIRYGVRVQFGIRSTDFFFNYDMNELFAHSKGPELHAMSFGIIF